MLVFLSSMPLGKSWSVSKVTSFESWASVYPSFEWIVEACSSKRTVNIDIGYKVVLIMKNSRFRWDHSSGTSRLMPFYS